MSQGDWWLQACCSSRSLKTAGEGRRPRTASRRRRGNCGGAPLPSKNARMAALKIRAAFHSPRLVSETGLSIRRTVYVCTSVQFSSNGGRGRQMWEDGGKKSRLPCPHLCTQLVLGRPPQRFQCFYVEESDLPHKWWSGGEGFISPSSRDVIGSSFWNIKLAVIVVFKGGGRGTEHTSGWYNGHVARRV